MQLSASQHRAEPPSELLRNVISDSWACALIDIARTSPALYDTVKWLVYALASASALFVVDAKAQGNEPLEEIIVTATKRPRPIEEVPLAVTAYTARDIEESGMQTIQRLTDLHPSVKFDQAHSFQNSSLKIRGIGTLGVSRTFEGAVGVYVDDVYRSRSGMALFDLLDIDQIEVMRGPQGALYGKNTVAGAITLQSTRPKLEETEGQLELRVGNLASRYLEGAYNAALGQDAAVRVAGVVHEQDGAFRSPDSGAQYDSIDRYAVKTQFLLRPNNDLQLRIIADYSKSDAECCWASAQVGNGPLAPIIAAYGSLHGLTFVPAPKAEQDRLESLNTTPREVIEDRGIALKIDFDLRRNLTLKSITAFRQWNHEHVNADPDFGPADLFVLNEPADIKNLSQELNLTLATARVNLLAGFYYGSENYRGWRSAETGSDADNYLNALISGPQKCLPPFVSTGCLFPVGIGALLPDGEFTHENYRQDSDGYALYADATTTLSDRFDLDTGVRYNVEHKTGGVDNTYWYDSAIVRGFRAALGIPDDGTPRNGFDLVGTKYSPSFSTSTRGDKWTGVVALEFNASRNLMAYASYQRGYKAGGVNLYREAVLTDTTVYAPEVGDSVEVGVKSSYLNGRARTDVAIFNEAFSNLQVNFFDGLNFRTENTGEARSRGVEVEQHLLIGERFTTSFWVTYLDSKFTTINEPYLSYLVGRDTPRAPRWGGVAQAVYDRPLKSGFALFARGMVSYTGDHYVGADVDTEQKVGSYVITDASIGVRNDARGWEILLSCSNCGDQTYRTIYFNSTFQPGSYNAYLNPPRMYGVTFRKTF
jgi:iron complex outermembrane receptor protein